MGTALRLDYLNHEEGLKLIQHQAQEKGIQLSPTQAETIYHQTGGLPLDMVYTVSHVATCGFLPDPPPPGMTPTNKVLGSYCIAPLVSPFRGQAPHHLLMALSLFPRCVSLETVAHVALPRADLAMAKQGLARLYQCSLIMKQQDCFSMHSLTRHYSQEELQAHPILLQQMCDRRVTWYQKLLQPFAEQDWQEWHDYSDLEQDWENLRSVVEWCRSQDRYTDFQQFWQGLKGYTLVCGQWLERLSWLDWLIQRAAQMQDGPTLTDAMYHKSRTLAHMNETDQTGEALALGQRAWDLSKNCDWQLQFDVSIYLATLQIRMRQFPQARSWITQAEAVLEPLSDQTLAYRRRWIQILYCRAEIGLRTQALEPARRLYSQALEQSQQINWKMMASYIRGWLAAIAMEQQEWTQAEQLLEQVRSAAEQHHDLRSLAFCQRYLAMLETARQNLSAAYQWATLARNSFERLSMFEEANEMRLLLQS